jgi:gluconokinase
VSQASGTGLFNQDACGWDRETVAISGVDPASLAPVAGLDDTGFELSPRLRRRWPRLAGARWLPAIGDGAANNAGAGCVTRGRAAVMIGTSGALRVLWAPGPAERVRQPFGLWRYRLDAHRILVGGALSNGGNVRDWMVRTLAADRRLQPRAEALEPDAHGLTVLPFLSGTRSPDYLTHATGTISGLTLATRPEHVLRASMEAVAYRFAGILEGLSDTVRVDEVVASGGALDRSVAWTQMLADVLNRPILLSPDKELTSRGAAAVGLDVLGIAPLEDLGPSISRRLRPHARRHDVYRAAMLRQRELMRRVYGRTKLSSG